MNMQRFTTSLVLRLIVFGVLMVIFGSVVRYFFLSRFLRENLVQVISAQQSSLAEYVASDIDYKLKERRLFLERLAATVPQELLAKPALLRGWLKERHELQPLFSRGLIVADVSGTVLVDYPPIPGRIGVSVPDNTDFPMVLGGTAVIGRPLMAPGTNLPVLPMMAPVKDSSGNVRAVLIGSTALAAPGFLNLLQQGRIGTSGGFLLISPKDKLFVAASDPAMVLQPTPPAGVNTLHDRAMEGFRGSGVTINAKGVEEISAMASVPSTGWFVVARLPSAEALATVQRTKEYIINHSLITIAIFIMMAGTFFFWILRPLRRAADQAEKMTYGEAPLAPLQVVREDEVGHLTAAFNRLLVKLLKSQAEAEYMAHHDALTGLPNRNLLDDRMKQALARSRRNNNTVALLFLDLDGFKTINDRLGHEAGDDALKEIARRFLAAVRETDTLARVGGDEFVLLAADLDEPAENRARTLAIKCIDSVSKQLHLHGSFYTIGVSVGIVLSDGTGNAERMLAAADKAMYEAKQLGGGRYVIAPFGDDSGTEDREDAA